MSSPAYMCCPSCRRRYVVVAEGDAKAALCGCGGSLETTTLADGVYEIRKSHKAARASKNKPHPDAKVASAPTAAAQEPMPREPDQGYNESHGYGPAHGGPTGPGDAPAPATEIASHDPG